MAHCYRADFHVNYTSDEAESETSSDMFDLGGVSDRASLVPASGLDINAGDGDDIDL